MRARVSRVVKSDEEIILEVEDQQEAQAIIAEREDARAKAQAQYDAMPPATPYTRQD